MEHMISLQRLPCAKTSIQERGCYCSADDNTTVTANITEMVPIRRHTTTLVHPFHHHRPHSCNCPLPIHFMLRCGLFITTDMLTQKTRFTAKRRRPNIHFASHRSAPCGKAPHVGHHQIRFFRTTSGSGVATRHAETPNHNDGAKYLSTADNCQTNCRAQPPRELVDLEWSQHGRELVMVESILSFF